MARSRREVPDSNERALPFHLPCLRGGRQRERAARAACGRAEPAHAGPVRSRPAQAWGGKRKGRAGARAARPSRFASTTPAAALLRLDTIHLAPNTMLSRSALVRPASLNRAVRIVRSPPALLLCRAREVELTLAVSALIAPPPPRPPSGPLCRLNLARSQPALARSLQTAADASTPATKVPEDANELVRPFVRWLDRRRPGPF
jgi:hypothetical protein